MAKTDVEPTPEGDALLDLLLEVSQVFFRFRDVGKRFGAVTPWGGGLWGMMRTLKLQGPMTVPQIARMRPVSRQRIQRLADDMAAEGLIEFIDNPAHKRSKLLRLTDEGEDAYRALTAEVVSLAGTIAEDLSEQDLREAAATLARVKDRLGSG